MPAKRSCKGKTKKGKPCKAAPLKGSDYCLAHSDAKTRESTGFIARNGKQGRPRKPRPSELSQHLMEENMAAIERPYWRALGYDLVVGDDGTVAAVALEGGGAKEVAKFQGIVSVSDVEDLGAQMEASEKLKDRVYGKPKQEVTVAGDLPLHLEVTGEQIIGDPDARKHAGAARRRVGTTRAQLARRAGAGH